MLPLAAALLGAPLVAAQAGIIPTHPNGVTNPDKPEFLPIGAQINMTSDARLLTLNSVDDFCLFGPPEEGPDSLIGNVEPIVVAYCTKPRNNARIIPDGTIHSAHFIRTDAYVQIYGLWDGTKVNIPAGDTGGELDPHGEKNLGNPIGGNVTSNWSGQDSFYEEWMSFISADQFCLRICTAQPGNVTAELMCEHELDIMGCRFVMAIDDLYNTNGTFTQCDGEVAAAPGLYPQADGSTSTFRQRYTGTWTNEAKETGVFTVGQTVTPSAPAFWPKKSNCVTHATISNGIDPANFMVTAAPVLFSGSAQVTQSVASTSQAAVTTPSKIIQTGGGASATGSAASGAASGDAAASGSGGAASPSGSGASSDQSNQGSGASSAVAFSGVLAAVGAIVGVISVF